MTLRTRAYAAAAFASLLFSVHYVVARRVLVEVTPLSLAALRGIVGGALLLAWSWRAVVKLDRRTMRHLVPIAALGFGLNQACFMFGLARSTPTEAALLSQSIPVFSALAGALILRERPSRSAWLGLGLGFVALATYFGLRFELALSAHLVGNALIVLNVISFAIAMALARKLMQAQPPALVTGAMLLLGGLGLGGLGHAELALLLAFELVISTAIAWLASMYAVKHLTLGESSVFVYAQVPVTALLSLAVGGTIGIGELALLPAVVLAAHLVRLKA